ncbi:hypothetical protein CVT26_007296 [Gymnopilus dilepis]|uniref:GST C-terminal domain-containing protein n=1 Tax=Gymnopilus dilepis TaxID=231916 RepID=A0A409VLW1_9AGAR|nr:hypothetical protein CVT26_007296 [Gymnopilus dilepis]
MATTRDTSSQSDPTKRKTEADGSFKGVPSSFRNFVEKGGKFEPEKDRYHLYISLSCPWATRATILRKLKGLESVIPVTVVSPKMDAQGWPFAQVSPFPGAEEDPLFKAEHVKDLYLKAEPNYTGRFTVPLIWDKKLQTIVNNESSDIIRIFNSGFNDLLPPEKAALDYYPKELQAEIDSVNEWIFAGINLGVYKTGFATTQEAYSKAVVELFEALDRVEKLLADSGSDYLVGDTLTEADVRLFTTVIRFDPVYVGHFKCNIRTIRDGYPAIHKWMRKLYWNNAAFKDTTDFDHIKTNYYWSHANINPTRIVPVGPIPHILPL